VSWRTCFRSASGTLARRRSSAGDPEGKIGNSAEFRDIYEISSGQPTLKW
jgi:hypothetical protein